MIRLKSAAMINALHMPRTVPVQTGELWSHLLMMTLTVGYSFVVVQSPSSTYALLNRIAFHPQAGFRDGDHVLVKDRYPLTVK